jgi:hypothetical protein
MTVVESKVRTGSLILGGVDTTNGGIEFSCQASAVSITSEFEEDGDTLETLCGDSILPATTESATLNFTAVQDFEDTDGLVRWSWAHSLEVVEFSWTPNKTKVPRITGTVQARRLDFGGEVNKRLTSDAEWPIQSGPNFDDVLPTVTATAGTPGTWAPPDLTPTSFTALTAAGTQVDPSPTAAWATGEYVECANSDDAYWNGTAWVSGQAP